MKELEAKKKVENYLNSIPIQKNSHLEHLRSYIQRITLFWLPGIFTYLSFFLLPRTNNKLEQFNCCIKRVYRKITGRKNAQLFLVNYGESVSFLLSMETKENLQSIFSLIPYDDFIYARNQLRNKSMRSKVFLIQRDLQEFLFQLEARK
jgi:hypothetical protein